MPDKTNPSPTPTIFDYLAPETVAVIDEDAYALLKANGYDTETVTEDKDLTASLAEQLSRRKEHLEYVTERDSDNGRIRVYFLLKHGKKVIARSRGVRMISPDDPEAKGAGGNANGV